jgi:hypothetical protein
MKRLISIADQAVVRQLRTVLLSAVACALTACQSSGTAAPSKSTQEQKFRLCDALGFRGLNVGRQYLVLHDSQEHIRSYLGSSPDAQAFASDFFARADAHQIQSHPRFAADELYACAEREGLTIGKPREQAVACYARADIPFFLAGVKVSTPNEADGVRRVEAILKDRTLYPVALITATADSVYASPPADIQKLMGTMFWSCLYNAEWTAKP